MNKELLILILAPILVFAWLWYQDKRQAKRLSDRLHNAENNIVRLKNER
jgi:type II secretory pathway pseudopilin PulG